MSWDEVGVAQGADKSSIVHNYLRHYERILGGREIQRLLEIGVDRGNSLRTWEQLFPDAEIIGIDIRPECATADVGYAQVYIGDATDRTWVRTMLEGRLLDLVIDDGSHQVQDAIQSFDILIPFVQSGGTYVIEDLPVGVQGAPMATLLGVLASRPECREIWCGRSAQPWGAAWPGIVMVTRA